MLMNFNFSGFVFQIMDRTDEVHPAKQEPS